MRIRELFQLGRPVYSFEFFPPKDDAGVGLLFERIRELRRLRPDFVSVTYGAGGSTRDRTIEIVTRIQKEIGLSAMAHLTCVGHTREQIATVCGKLRAAGIVNVLALRGDPPKGESEFHCVEGGFRYASELAAFLKDNFDFTLGGACYPEKHVEAPNADEDLLNLKKKVDAGVEFLISQLFFDNKDYFNFVERARAAGITLPILPGIMPVSNFEQIKRFTLMCGAKLPPDLLAKLERNASDPVEVFRIGCDHATAQCRELLDRGAPGVHFYTLNKSTATREIFKRLIE
ncbi:MAG: methylenetetrahydrofolate reductase [NAD(P)H] [Planctomycetes bacterium]|nr:methylenetetrahydrofolate reductase [NAD(P)H] [Planctomycetota bacterium]